MKFAFVRVDDWTTFRQTYCMQCCERGGSYLREIGTHLPYCDYECYVLFYEALAERKVRARAAS
jgi:hypothetical protein